ncbi:hypothetical protein [Amycolatopsis suaedae]|uniref:Translation initiation factor 2 n=1 Tax=Amycolatopsis suaedae TaxID=2510978 RepID=A0A4Q7J5E8_9PSEU|nr:hypothetical protein [Amycolatopsis suaedae]RZQ61244.1 hypothetical protein EWH70_25600 [Amycolatopsis suaedae]
MSTARWLTAPLGPRGSRWRTIAPQRTVLVVVHTVTAMNRFADILPVFDSDRRIQLVFTFPAASAVSADVERFLADAGAVVLPWEQALHTRFDLALSAHHSGNLHEISASLVLLSHGIGYTKYSAGTGNREPETGNRVGSVYGLSAQWLERDGALVPASIVLSHPEQLDRLATAVPGAVDAAVLAGDPCHDRIAASLAERDRYRARLGADDDTTVVAVTSTWGERSLFGSRPGLIADLLAELGEGHVVAAILHPNTWYAHGPAQIRLWLADCLRAGLRLIPPLAGWQQTIIAADVVIGDNGAVTGYAAAAGRPVLLAAFPEDAVVPGTAIDALGAHAPRLDPGSRFAAQLDAARRAPLGAVRELATSTPGQSAGLLRREFYRLLGLSEPDTGPVLTRYRAGDLVPERAAARAWWVAVEAADDGVTVRRWPADVVARPGHGPRAAACHLVVAADHPRRDLLSNATVVLLERGSDAAEVFRDVPAAAVAVSPTAGGCLVQHRDGAVSAWHASGPAAEVAGSVVHVLGESEVFEVTLGRRGLVLTRR